MATGRCPVHTFSIAQLQLYVSVVALSYDVPETLNACKALTQAKRVPLWESDLSHNMHSSGQVMTTEQALWAKYSSWFDLL